MLAPPELLRLGTMLGWNSVINKVDSGRFMFITYGYDHEAFMVCVVPPSQSSWHTGDTAWFDVSSMVIIHPEDDA